MTDSTRYVQTLTRLMVEDSTLMTCQNNKRHTIILLGGQCLILFERRRGVFGHVGRSHHRREE